MRVKDTFFSKKRTLNLRGTLYELSSPVVMGILNITPDSFYDGGRYSSDNEILNRCETILVEGATFVDIGAYSSRPGAEHVSEDEEIRRLDHALKLIRSKFPDAFLSVDTFRSKVARFVVEQFGVQMINDIAAGNLDADMIPTVGGLRVPYIMMHMRGTPQNMHQQTDYQNYIVELLRYFAEKTHEAKLAGIHDIIIDPGFGFSKTIEQNYELLSRLDEFRIFELPILAGLSRKSMIYKLLETTPEQALSGTIAANTLALLGGADILRVHDVKAAMDTIKVVNAIKL